MSSEDSTTPAPSKSKQERIRDNQRRSRARRQEYLADLERRLNDCHVSCREADLQRAEFVNLKAENARLRALLKSAGINPDVMETHGRQAVPQQPVDLAPASVRQIKPKLQTSEMLNPPPTLKREISAVACCPVSSFSSSCPPPQSPVLTEAFHNYHDQFGNQLVAPPTTLAPTLLSTPNASLETWYAWRLSSDNGAANTLHENTFICDTFHVPPNGFLLQDDGNSIQCSVAKDMIERYNPTQAEMDEIVARLATAFTQPAYPGGGCKVHAQILLQVLSEMNGKQIQG